MKKVISYIKLRRVNPFLLLAAALLFVVAFSTITYSWVEGAASVTLKNENDTITVADTNAPIVVDVNSNTDISLNSYIERCDSLFLAPAASDNGESINIYNDELTSTRQATTNDIGNNYIEFDFKITTDTSTDFNFTQAFPITIAGIENSVNPINISFQVDEASPKILKASEISADTTAFSLSVGDHIVTARIWYQYSDSSSLELMGKTVSFDLTLTPIPNTIELTFEDKTNDTNKFFTLAGRRLEAYQGDTLLESVSSFPSDNSYTFTKIPRNSTITFKAFNGSTLISQWTVSTPAAKCTYTAYGNLNAESAMGALNSELVTVNFYDKSYDKIYSAQSYVSVSNGTDEIIMCKSTDTYSCFAPASSFGSEAAGNIYFNAKSSDNTSIYYAQAAASSAQIDTNSVHFSIFGATEHIGDSGDTLSYGQWGNVETDEITFRDRTEGEALAADPAAAIKVACTGDAEADETNSYLAAFVDGEWRMNIPRESENLVFTAAKDGSTYTWDNSDTANRAQTNGRYIYTATAAADDSTGTWQYRVNITLADAPHAIVTASFSYSYINTNGTTTVHEGALDETNNTAEVPEGTTINVQAITARRVIDTANIAQYGELNGHIFQSFSVGEASYSGSTSNNDTYTSITTQGIIIGDSDMTIETNTEAQNYFIGGDNLSGIDSWNGQNNNREMTYNSENNSFEYTLSMSASPAQIKIAEIGFTSAYRDAVAHSVTLNDPTVEIAEGSSGITSASLSGTGNNNVVLSVQGSTNTEFTVTYALSTNTLIVSSEAGEQPTGRVVYFDNSVTNWTTVAAHMWNNYGDSTVWGNAIEMEHIGNNIYRLIITEDSYDYIIFRDKEYEGKQYQTGDLTINDGQIYVVTNAGNSNANPTGNWEPYTPGEETTGRRLYLKIGNYWSSVIGAYLWNSNNQNTDWDTPVSMYLVSGTTDIYYLEYEEYTNYDNIIFRGRSGNSEYQTVDIKIPSASDNTDMFILGSRDNLGKYTGNWAEFTQ